MQLFAAGKIRRIKENSFKSKSGENITTYDVVLLHDQHDEPVTISVNKKYIQDFIDLQETKKEVDFIPVTVRVYNNPNGAMVRVVYTPVE